MRLRKTPEERMARQAERRGRRAERRRGRVTARQGTQQEADEVAEDVGYPVSGIYTPMKRDITLFPGADDSVREHEFVHSEQYGPLRALFNAPRIQDPQTRKSIRDITRSISDDVYDSLGQSGFSPLKYMIDRPIEFEAILRAGVNSPNSQGIDFGKDFDSILNDLNALPEGKTDTNVRLLRSAMGEGDLTPDQKDLFLRAIRSNLRS